MIDFDDGRAQRDGCVKKGRTRASRIYDAISALGIAGDMRPEAPKIFQYDFGGAGRMGICAPLVSTVPSPSMVAL